MTCDQQPQSYIQYSKIHTIYETTLHYQIRTTCLGISELKQDCRGSA